MNILMQNKSSCETIAKCLGYQTKNPRNLRGFFFVAEPYAGTIASTGQLSTQAPQSVQVPGSIT